MRASSIRHLAITDEPSIVAAALFEKTVQIWSCKTGKQLGEFQTMLDFGGKRLALTPDGSSCIVGAWGQRARGPRGLAAYSIPDGKLLWNREEIRHIQYVRLSGSGREIYCGIEGSSAHIINSATGETLERVRRATKIVGSRYTAHQLIVQTGSRYLVRGQNQFEIPAQSFALLDAVFSPEAICLSEAKDGMGPSENIGGIRLFDLATGELRWHSNLGAKNLTFNFSDQRFYCVAENSDDPSNRSLVRLRGDILQCDQVLALGRCWETAFSPSGNILVTVHGDVYDTATGTQTGFLGFPQRDYPDS
jgi:WD40 repeat protein